jgi:hypothetical protein
MPVYTDGTLYMDLSQASTCRGSITLGFDTSVGPWLKMRLGDGRILNCQLIVTHIATNAWDGLANFRKV